MVASTESVHKSTGAIQCRRRRLVATAEEAVERNADVGRDIVQATVRHLRAAIGLHHEGDGSDVDAMHSVVLAVRC